jgi:hypothetical protein
MFKRSITRADLLKLSGALAGFVSWAVLIHCLMPMASPQHPWLFSLEADVGFGLALFVAFCISYLRDL